MELVKFDQIAYLKFAFVISCSLICILFVIIGAYIVTTGDVPIAIVPDVQLPAEEIEVAELPELPEQPDEPEPTVQSDQLEVNDFRKAFRTRSKRDTYYSYPPEDTPFATWYDAYGNICDPTYWPDAQMENSMRQRRDLTYPPNYYDDALYQSEPAYYYQTDEWHSRAKRQDDLEDGIKYWEEQYVRCKKSAPDSPDCDLFQDNILTLVSELETSFMKVKKYLGRRDRTNQWDHEPAGTLNDFFDGRQSKYQPFPNVPSDGILRSDMAPDPLNFADNSRQEQFGFVDSNVLPESAPIHEDLNVGASRKFGHFNDFNVESVLRLKNDQFQHDSQINGGNQMDQAESVNNLQATENKHDVNQRNVNPMGMHFLFSIGRNSYDAFHF